MQLLIILALLLYGGKSNAKNLIEEVKPVLESIGGEDMKQALKSAEEITEVLSAVQELTKSADKADASGQDKREGKSGFANATCGAASRAAEAAPQENYECGDGNTEEAERCDRADSNCEREEESCYNSERRCAFSFPLAPISEIADRDITYSLSRYLSQN